MNRFVTDDFYDDEGGCSDVYNDNPDDWVLERILERRGAEGSWRYHCTWDGYEERTWETTERLASLGYLSRAKAFDAEQTVVPVSVTAALTFSGTKGDRTVYERLKKMNVQGSFVGPSSVLMDPSVEIPLAFPRPDSLVGESSRAARVSFLETHSQIASLVDEDPSYDIQRKHHAFQKTPASLTVFRVDHESVSWKLFWARLRELISLHARLMGGAVLSKSSRVVLLRVASALYKEGTSFEANLLIITRNLAGCDKAHVRGFPPTDLLAAWTARVMGSDVELWFPDGRRYRGYAMCGTPNGEGEMLLANDTGRITGRWSGGRPSGPVKTVLHNISIEAQYSHLGLVSLKAMGPRLTGFSVQNGDLGGPTAPAPFLPQVLTPRMIRLIARDKTTPFSLQSAFSLQELFTCISENQFNANAFRGWLSERVASAPVLEVSSSRRPRRQQTLHGSADDDGCMTLTFANGTYVGAVQPWTSKRHGKGRYTWSSGHSYEGDWVDNAMHGSGTYRWADGRCYVGQFMHDVLHGRGCYDFGDGSRFEGEFKADMIDGHGMYVSDTGREVAVEWNGVDPLDAIFMATPAFDKAAADSAEAEARAVHRRRPREDPRTAAMAVPSHLPPASLLSDEGVEPHCVICRDETKTRAVVPCGHLCVCDECSNTGKVTQCPLCRVPVEMLMKLYM